ncbi:MAG: DMT family transporter [Oscillospiraceae bacterium]|nr:DMT family transporter [Oscillospiraceae bacterium]
MNKAKGAMLSAMVIFGTVGIFVRYIGLPSATVACFRGILGAVVLLAVMGLTGKKLCLQSIGRNLPLLILSGAAIGGNWIALFEAYRYTSVAVATVCYYLAPMFLVLASPLLGERLTGKKLALSGVALMGMVFVSGVLKGGVTGFRGIALGVIAAALYASVMFMNKKLGDISAYDKTVVQLSAAAAVILPYCLLTGGFAMEQVSLRGYILLGVVGIVHTGLAYWLYFGALGQLPSQKVAIFSYLDPVVAILLSALWLREPLGWQEFTGAALILGSALCSELTGKKVVKKG